jgi:hypothetical protein
MLTSPRKPIQAQSLLVTHEKKRHLGAADPHKMVTAVHHLLPDASLGHVDIWAMRWQDAALAPDDRAPGLLARESGVVCWFVEAAFSPSFEPDWPLDP